MMSNDSGITRRPVFGRSGACPVSVLRARTLYSVSMPPSDAAAGINWTTIYDDPFKRGFERVLFGAATTLTGD